MIRSRLHNPVIRMVAFDSETQTLIIELTDLSTIRYSPVRYELYERLVTSRFPEKIYRHDIRDQVPVVGPV